MTSRKSRKMNSKSEPQPDTPPKRHEVGIAVCGGIAAYKVAQVTSALVQQDIGVTVAMTAAARQLVGPATFEALTGRPAVTDLWQQSAPARTEHIRVTDAIDLLLIAPATFNIIGKVAGGIADEVVSTIAAAVGCPVLIAPAMNQRMWANPILQRNLEVLVDTLGYEVISPGKGHLSCGHVGPGRLADPEVIVERVLQKLAALKR